MGFFGPFTINHPGTPNIPKIVIIERGNVVYKRKNCELHGKVIRNITYIRSHILYLRENKICKTLILTLRIISEQSQLITLTT